MSLLQCPECKGMVSSAATTCPHCGFPMQNQKYICTIDGVDVDLSEAFRIWKSARPGDDSRIRGRKSIMTTAKIGLMDAAKIWDSFNEHKCVPSQYTTTSPTINSVAVKPACPMCKSTLLTKKGAGARMIDGFFYGRHSVEGRAQWRCESCGHLW